MKPNSPKIAHFPKKNYYNLHFTTTTPNQFFPTIPHTYFATEFRTTFSFIEPTGHIGYIEVPSTIEKPEYYQVNITNTLIHNVTHTYHPEIAELVPHTNYSLQFIDDTVRSHQFSLHQVYMTNSDTPPITSPIYNIQPTSHTSKPRIFPSSPYTTENLKFTNKINFQFSDLTHTECITLCSLLPKYETFYATQKSEVGKIANPFCVRLKPNAQLVTQRLSKVPNQY